MERSVSYTGIEECAVKGTQQELVRITQVMMLLVIQTESDLDTMSSSGNKSQGTVLCAAGIGSKLGNIASHGGVKVHLAHHIFQVFLCGMDAALSAPCTYAEAPALLTAQGSLGNQLNVLPGLENPGMQARTNTSTTQDVTKFEPRTCENITVAVRFRPIQEAAPHAWHVAGTGKVVLDEALQQKRRGSQELGLKPQSSAHCPSTYTFDAVFDGSASTRDVYTNSVHSIVQSALDGVNGSTLAYGATGSGKTFTMVGDNVAAGIITMALADMFTEIAKRSCSYAYDVSATMIELYNEQITDLFDDELPSFPGPSRAPIQLVVRICLLPRQVSSAVLWACCMYRIHVHLRMIPFKQSAGE
jgi:hypothetical protein